MTEDPTKRAACLLVPALVCAIAVGAAFAGTTQKLLPDGSLHTIVVEPRAADGAGTRLTDRVLAPDGSVSATVLPGTDDSAVEADPVLAVDAVTHLPVAFWTRTDGGSSEINFAFHNGKTWSMRAALTTNSFPDMRARAIAGRSGLVHVMWEAILPGTGQTSYFHAVLSKEGKVVLPPTEIRLGAFASDPLTGLPAENIGDDEIFFVIGASSKSGRTIVHAFGGIDEPIPIVHRGIFVLPDGSPQPDSVAVESVGSRSVLLVRGPRAVIFSARAVEGWMPYGSLSFDQIGADRAELLIREMLSSPGSPLNPPVP